MADQKPIYTDAGKPNGALPATATCVEPGTFAVGGSGDRVWSISNGNLKTPESVDEAYRRLVLDAPSLLPRCEMPVARLLFAEWLAEQKARKELEVVTHE